jgi:RNase P subunit RPR2
MAEPATATIIEFPTNDLCCRSCGRVLIEDYWRLARESAAPSIVITCMPCGECGDPNYQITP